MAIVGLGFYITFESQDNPLSKIAMAYYRKKPITIEAKQFLNNLDEIKEFVGEHLFVVEEEVYIKTLEGLMTVSYEDWIIKGIKGEFYPCKPDIFAASYEITF